MRTIISVHADAKMTDQIRLQTDTFQNTVLSICMRGNTQTLQLSKLMPS
jgi:hypothetical protein